MKKIITMILISLMIVNLCGCKEDNNYLEPLEQDIEKEGESTAEFLVIPVSLPEMVKDSHVIVSGKLESKVLNSTMNEFGTDEANDFVKSKNPNAEAKIVYETKTYNFTISEVIKGEISTKKIQLVLSDFNNYVKPDEEVLLLLIENQNDKENESSYTLLAGGKSVFSISKEGKVKSKSGSRFTANYDNKEYEKLIKDIKKAIDDPNIEGLLKIEKKNNKKGN